MLIQSDLTQHQQYIKLLCPIVSPPPVYHLDDSIICQRKIVSHFEVGY